MSIFEFSQRVIDETVNYGLKKHVREEGLDEESYKAGARDVIGIAINVAIELQKKEWAENSDENRKAE